MKIITNPLRGAGLPDGILDAAPFPSVDAGRPSALLARCPMHEETPLVSAEALAKQLGVGSVWLKDETNRFNLGSFKALGAAYVIANQANNQSEPVSEHCLNGTTFVTASAGNHGLSVARGAQIFGADAVVFIADTVPESFENRLQSYGAKVMRCGASYEDAMEAALIAAQDNNWILLSDSAWDGYTELPRRVMEGYLTMGEEITQQIDAPPTHIFLQAGVGGLAASMAAYFRHVWRDGPQIIVVEPEAAPALFESIEAQRPVDTTGPVSEMGRLDCKTPSNIGLKGLARDADRFMLISEDAAADAVSLLAKHGIASTPSGVAGLAGLVAAREELSLLKATRTLMIISEGQDG